MGSNGLKSSTAFLLSIKVGNIEIKCFEKWQKSLHNSWRIQNKVLLDRLVFYKNRRIQFFAYVNSFISHERSQMAFNDWWFEIRILSTISGICTLHFALPNWVQLVENWGLSSKSRYSWHSEKKALKEGTFENFKDLLK